MATPVRPRAQSRGRTLLGLLPALALAVAVSGATNANPDGPTPDEPPGPLSGEPGASDPTLLAARTPKGLILKLREGVDPCLSCGLAQGRSLGPLAPGSRLDELNRRYGVRLARPLVRAHARGLVPETPAQAAGRRERVAQRFAARARRAPRNEVSPDFSRTYVLETRRRLDLETVAREYAADPAVEYCEPDYVVSATLLPNDPFLSTSGSWGQEFADLWGIERVQAPAAWDTTRGAGSVIAIIDTGIDYNHPDIAANVWVNPGEIPDNDLDDDENGFVDDVRGWDFADDDADPIDDYGHGTHVAGTAAAVGDNGTGVVGVAYESQVMAVRGLGTYGSAPVSVLVEAILYAVDQGADVINASWGGYFSSQTLEDALATAHAAGVVFVASAGNSSRDAATHLPSACRDAIAVAALNHEDELSDFSNYGLSVDLAAPGGGDDPPPREKKRPDRSILSLHSDAIHPYGGFGRVVVLEQDGAEYLRLSGTSMAAPHVAGTAALVLSVNPGLSVEQVRQVLRSTAIDLGPPGPDEEFSYGCVDAAAAVLAPPPLVAHITAPGSGTISGALSIPIEGTASGPGFGSYSLDYRPADDPNGWSPIAGPIASPVDAGVLAEWNVEPVPDGDYVVRLTAERSGENFTDRIPVTLHNVVIDAPEPLSAIRAVDSVEIYGTAAGGGFMSYRVEYRRPAIDSEAWLTDGLVQAAPPGTPVRNGLLATLDVSGLSEGDRFDFRLTVETASGSGEKRRSGIVIDPTLREGWPQPIVPVWDINYLTVADLDADGTQEILVGSGDEVVVFEPDGSLRPGWPQSVTTEEFPDGIPHGSPLAADVVGDGQLEVIATNRGQILAWSADGTLLPGFPLPVADAGTNWLMAGDIDGDGKHEIVCTGRYEIQFYRGDGAEMPELARSLSWGQKATAIGDVDGDGRAEIAYLDPTRSSWTTVKGMLKLMGPDGDILASRKTVTKYYPRVSMADLDGDGLLDVHVVQERKNGKIKVRAIDSRSNRLKLKAAKVASGRDYREGNAQLSFADLDGDGRAEAYSYQRGAGPTRSEDEFGYFVAHQHKSVSDRRAPLMHQLFKSGQPGGIAIGDVDGDGVQELVAGMSGSGCGVYACSSGSSSPVRRGVVIQRLDGSLLPKFPKPLPQRISSDGDPYDSPG